MNYKVLIFLLAVSGCVFGENELGEKNELLNTYLDQIGGSSSETFREFVSTALGISLIELRKTNMDIDDNQFTHISDAVSKVLEREFLYKNRLREIQFEIYAEHFDENDLRVLIEFNNTPTGTKILKELPSMVAQSHRLKKGLYDELESRISQEIEDLIAEKQ